MKKIFGCMFVLLFAASWVNAQKAEITISLNEQFFDTLLDAIYLNASPPEFPLSQNIINRRDAESQRTAYSSFAFQEIPASQRIGGKNPVCNESIRLLREANGMRTAVRFRDGKIYAPLAFAGNYNPPLIGCVDFSGWAETNIELEFDQQGQRLLGRARVLNVSLNGTGGVGSGILTRMVQSSIDKKINPIEIIKMDKLSFVVPIQNSGSMRMKALGVRHEVGNGVLNIHIAFEFLKA